MISSPLPTSLPEYKLSDLDIEDRIIFELVNEDLEWTQEQPKYPEDISPHAYRERVRKMTNEFPKDKKQWYQDYIGQFDQFKKMKKQPEGSQNQNRKTWLQRFLGF
jgi:hypothetical protein